MKDTIFAFKHTADGFLAQCPHLGTEAGNDAVVFPLADAFGGRGEGQADAAGKFGKGEAAIHLQFFKNMPANLVQQ